MKKWHALEHRVAKLETKTVADDAPASIPQEWLRTDPLTGEPVGPGPDETMTDGQRRTWPIARAMQMSVPYCPG